MGKACLPVVKYIITIKMSRVFVSTCMWKYPLECEISRILLYYFIPVRSFLNWYHSANLKVVFKEMLIVSYSKQRRYFHKMKIVCRICGNIWKTSIRRLKWPSAQNFVKKILHEIINCFMLFTTFFFRRLNRTFQNYFSL